MLSHNGASRKITLVGLPLKHNWMQQRWQHKEVKTLLLLPYKQKPMRNELRQKRQQRWLHKPRLKKQLQLLKKHKKMQKVSILLV